MKKPLLLLFILLASLLALQVASATSIIVINDTEPDVVSLQKVVVSGDLSANTLSILGGGEVLSEGRARVYLFGPSQEVLIKNLFVGGAPRTVSFDELGYFFLAEEGTFSFVADMEVRTIGQLRLFVPGPINELNFDIDHGYVIDGDRFGIFEEQVIIQRSEKVAMIVDGNFRFSFALRNQFSYFLNFRAFGSTLGRFTLDLPNGETVTSVTGALKWDQVGNILVIDLQGSTANLIVNGLFTSKNLRIPLREDTHHILIESDPEKKISISTGAKEIDLSEAGVSPTYANARAFLANPFDRFSITVKQLKLEPSLAASVSRATSTVAITPKGSIVGQLEYTYANTGQDYIEMDVPGTPLYASTARGAVKLTSDGKLLLSFPKSTRGSLSVVYVDTVKKLLPINFVQIPLAKSDIPITTMTTKIYLPADKLVLYLFGAKGGSDLPEFKGVILFTLLMGFLAWLLRDDRRFIISYVIFATGALLFDPVFFMLLVGITLFVKIKGYLSKGKMKWIFAGAGLLIVGGIVIFVIGQLSTSLMSVSPASYDSYGMEGRVAIMEDAVAAPAAMKGLTRLGGDEAGAISVPVRTGVLPVRLDIPRLGKLITVTNHLVTKENPVSLSIIIVSDWLRYILVAFALLPGLFCLRFYRATKAPKAPQPVRQ